LQEPAGKLKGIKRNNYLPYGESANTLGGRSADNGYVAESVRRRARADLDSTNPTQDAAGAVIHAGERIGNNIKRIFGKIF
jgi:hypothetical protein